MFKSAPSPNQKRTIKPPTPTPNTYSASPSQLSLSSDLPSAGLPNPYQSAYGYAPHDGQTFGFPHPSQYRPPLQTQGLQQQHSLPQPSSISPLNQRKRRASDIDDLPGSSGSNASIYSHPTGLTSAGTDMSVGMGGQLPSPVAKKGRTNTPWTPAEEQRLKALRDAGSSWSEIAKTFPNRTEGSVKKHWYKVRPCVILSPRRCSLLTALTGHALCGFCGRRGQQFRSPHRETCVQGGIANVVVERAIVTGHKRLREQQVESHRTESGQTS